VIGVLFRFQIENQRRETENAKCARGKNPAFQAGRGPLAQDSFWRPRGIAKIVRDLIQETLHTGWRFQRAQFAQL